MFAAFQNIARIEELRKRILFTAAMLAVYRVGCIVVTPGINSNVIRQFFSDMAGTMFGLLNIWIFQSSRFQFILGYLIIITV